MSQQKKSKQGKTNFLDGFSKKDLKEILPSGFDNMSEADQDAVVKNLQKYYEKSSKSEKKDSYDFLDGFSKKDLKEIMPSGFEKMTRTEKDAVVKNFQKYYEKSPSKSGMKIPNDFLSGISKKDLKDILPSGFEKMPKKDQDSIIKNLQKEYDKLPNSPKKSAKSSSPKKTSKTSSPKKTAKSSSPKKNSKTSSPKKTAKSSSPKKTAKSSSPKKTDKASSLQKTAKSSSPKKTDKASSPQKSTKNAYFNKKTEPDDYGMDRKRTLDFDDKKKSSKKSDEPTEKEKALLFKDVVVKNYIDLVKELYPKLKQVTPDRIVPHHTNIPDEYKPIAENNTFSSFHDKLNQLRDLHQMAIKNSNAPSIPKEIFAKGEDLTDHYTLSKSNYILDTDNIEYLSDKLIIELYNDYKELYLQHNEKEAERLLKAIDRQISKRKLSPNDYIPISDLISELSSEYKKRNIGLVIKDEHGAILKQGDKNFVKNFTTTVNNEVDLAIECAAPGEKAKPFAYQIVPSLALAPRGSCNRLLCIQRTGAGKTVAILRIMANFYYDPRPKILFFPDSGTVSNFVKELCEPMYSDHNPYQDYIRSAGYFEEIFILTKEKPKWWPVFANKKLEDAKIYFDFNILGVKDALQKKQTVVSKDTFGNGYTKYDTKDVDGFMKRFEKFQEAKSALKGDAQYRRQGDAQKKLFKSLSPQEIKKAYEKQIIWMSNKKVDTMVTPLVCLTFQEGGGSKFRLHEKKKGGKAYNQEKVSKLTLHNITSYPRIKGEKFTDKFSNLKSENMGLNIYNNKIIAFDEIHKAQDPLQFIKNATSDTIENIGYLMNLMRDMSGSVLAGFTATPGDSKKEIDALVDIVKGTENKDKSAEGFISYWNFSPTTLYPSLIEPNNSRQDLLANDHIIDMYTTRSTVNVIKLIKKGREFVHPFEVPNDKKTDLRKDKNEYFTPGTFYYTYHKEHQKDIDKYKQIHKMSENERKKFLQKFSKPLDNLMAMCNIPIKSTVRVTRDKFIEHVNTLPIEDLEDLSEKLYYLAKKIVETKYKSIILLDTKHGLEFFTIMLTKYLEKLTTKPGMARCTDEKIKKKEKSPCFVTMIDADADKYLVDLFNSPANIRGDVIKAAILEPKTYGTGISFFGVRNVYIVNPPTNFADYQQYIGRAMRACRSHHIYEDENEKLLREDEKEVYVNMFVSVMEEGVIGAAEDLIGSFQLKDEKGKYHKYPQIQTIDEINLEKIQREEREQSDLYKKELQNHSIDFEIYDKLI